MTIPQCGNCMFSHRTDATVHGVQDLSAELPKLSNLECHRNPPTLFLLGSPEGVSMMSAWPTVPDTMMCGEYEIEQAIDAEHFATRVRTHQDLSPDEVVALAEPES